MKDGDQGESGKKKREKRAHCKISAIALYSLIMDVQLGSPTATLVLCLRSSLRNWHLRNPVRAGAGGQEGDTSELWISGMICIFSVS